MLLSGTAAVALVTASRFGIEAWIKVRGALLLKMACQLSLLI